ncbi:MAG: hypothetical protein FJ255_02745 [Phycisphaerae bacterium]|nr:hypothetical protein [Phycisphaerae bacterium]
MNTTTALAILAAGLCLAASSAPAQDDAPLRGPDLPDAVMRTIVRHDAMGRFVRVEGRPEEAALGQLNLDPMRRNHAREAILDRAAAINRHLVENIDLVRDSTDAILARNNAKAQEVARKLHDLFDPRHERSPLLAPLAEALTEEEHRQLTRMVDEYWSAWIESEQRTGRQRDVATVQERLVATLFQEDVQRAYERTLRPIRDRLERVYAAVEPTPEQRAQIRDAMLDYVKESALRPTPEQRQALARRIYEALDEDRRVRLLAAALFQS